MPKFVFYIVVLVLFSSMSCHAAEVLIIGDYSFKPVADTIKGINKTLSASSKTYSPEEVRNKAYSIVQREDAKVVIALGSEAIKEALSLPPSIPVIYGMVVIPLEITRPNTACFYMSTPSEEYIDLLQKFLPSINRIAAIARRPYLRLLTPASEKEVISFPVKSPSDFKYTLQNLKNMDAVLLLPDGDILTTASSQEAFLYSFRNKIPLLGISERHVKEGSLLALVVDLYDVGKNIGNLASKAIKTGTVWQQNFHPHKFDLYLNLETANKMNISVPDKLVRMARKIYQ